MYTLDYALLNARVVDPVNKRDGIFNIGVRQGRIEEITTGDLGARAHQVMDFSGMLAMPGLVDCHSHVTSQFGSGCGGLHMLAKAGVCTALDMAGPTHSVLELMRDYGSGINMATVDAILPGVNISGQTPDRDELCAFFKKALHGGAIGGKLLGGHYPLTPEASADFVAAGRQLGAYVAWHAGSTATCNTVAALEEVLERSQGHFVHVAHINSYCRGQTRDALEEVQQAAALLQQHPNVCSESYIAATNGTSFNLGSDGRMKSKATGRNLEYYGYEDSAKGIQQALADGFARVFVSVGLENVPVTGQEALAFWQEHHGEVRGGFDVNPPLPRTTLAILKRPNGDFVVDALATDGGAIPRNVILSQGLALVDAGALTLQEFIFKASYAPARMLCLGNKGHLAPGADADITVCDPTTRTAVLTMAGGKVCMYKGYVCGSRGTIITTAEGVDAVVAAGLGHTVADYTQGPLPFRGATLI